MNTSSQRRAGIFAITIAVAVSATALAQQRTVSPRSTPQRQSQERHPIGEQQWSQDGTVLYQWTARGWVPTGWRRTFPDRRNMLVYDMYLNDVLVRRRDDGLPGWTQTLEYTGTGAGFWWRWPNNNPQAIYIYYGSQWWLGTQLVAALQAQVAGLSQPRSGNRNLPVPSCGASPCTKATVDKVTQGITAIPQIQQLYKSMPSVP